MAAPRPFTAAMIIPTGIGAAIGGYGGDAAGEMNLLAGVCDVLITHPNVANAAVFQKLPANALYVEGYALDRFFEGAWDLQPVRKNRVGVVLDRGIDPEMLTLHLNTINAVQSVYGVDFTGYTLTEEPLSLHCGFDPSGASTGGIDNPEALLDACRELLRQGADALAICAKMPELEGESDYKSGAGVDPVGGIEAILSHLAVARLQIPCAHAPVFSMADAQPETSEVLDPRTAPEFIAPTFLPCVLTGLQQAPRPVAAGEHPEALNISHLNVLVVPGDALGGIPVLEALRRNIPVIAVTENTSRMGITPDDFPADSPILTARSYYEAAGMLSALRQGLPVPFPRTQKVQEIVSRLAQTR